MVVMTINYDDSRRHGRKVECGWAGQVAVAVQ